MIVIVSYDPTDPESILKAESTKRSIEKQSGWDPVLRPKISREFHLQSPHRKWIKNGKMKSHEDKIEKYSEEESQFYQSFVNYQIEARSHFLFWQSCFSSKKPMAFIEAGMYCYGDWENLKFNDCLMLHFQHAFDYPTAYEKYYLHTPKNREHGTHQISDRYPLENSQENEFKGSRMIAGADAYVVTPKGAKKLIDGVTKYGLDQASHVINTKLVNIDYLFPSTFRYDVPDLLVTDGTRLP